MSRHQQIQLMKHAHMRLKMQQILIKRQSHWKIFPFIINNDAIPLTETGYKLINSKISNFGQYELILTGNYNVDMSSNFKYKDPDIGLVIGSPTVDYSKISQKYMSAILNFNSVVFSSLIQIHYDSQEWLPFALSYIPLVGKLLNFLTLGVPVGWVITQNIKQYRKMLYFNGFMIAFLQVI